MNKQEEIRWPLNKGKHQIQRNVNQMKNEMPLSSIRQENSDSALAGGGMWIKEYFQSLSIKMGIVIAVWKRNLTASIRSKNIPHLNNPTSGNLNTTMYVRTRVFKVLLLIAKKTPKNQLLPANWKQGKRLLLLVEWMNCCTQTRTVVVSSLSCVQLFCDPPGSSVHGTSQANMDKLH